MPQVLFRASKGFADENKSYLSGTGSPGGDASFQDVAKVGSSYQNIDNGDFYIKTVDGAGSSKWKLLATYESLESLVTGKQPLDNDLTAIAALAGTSGFLKKTAADTWTLDTNTYLTGNQSITFTGDVTGSGSTSVTLTLANSGVSASTYKSVTVDEKGRVTAGTNPTTLAGYGITDAVNTSDLGSTVATLVGGLVPTNQLPSYVDDVLEYANLAGFPVTGETAKIYVAIDTNKIYRWTGTVYIEISPVVGNSDTATKLVTARSISASGDATWTVNFDGSANVSSALTLANSGVTAGTYKSVTVDAKGRVTAGTNPTTLAGYGITDAVALTTDKLSQFAATSSAELAGIISDETGTGKLVFANSPVLVTPSIGVATGTSFNSITGLSSTNPLANGTASFGTSTLVSRQDHVHPSQTTITGNAGTATALQTARSISASGDATWTVNFDGSANVSSALTLANSGVTAGTYKSVTVDAKGRVTAGTNPTTLAGYGITDAASSSHTHTFASLTSKPTTLSGYGITDAAADSQTMYIGTTAIAINRASGALVLTGITSIDGSAATLDGIDSASFLRSDVADIKTAGALTFNDNIYCYFGTGNDAKIYHNGTHAYIDVDVTGELILRNNRTSGFIYLQAKNASSVLRTCIASDAAGVELYSDGAKKLETTATGVTVTGVVTATSFSGNGASVTGVNAATLSGASLSSAAGSSTVVQRTGSGYVYANYFNTTPNVVTGGITAFCVETGDDGFIRHAAPATVLTAIGAAASSHTHSYLPLAGGIMTGALQIKSAGSSGIELGRTDGVASTPYIDFHSGAVACDHDVRFSVSGGNGVQGYGDLNIFASNVVFSRSIECGTSVKASDWFRSYGATGWYNETYTGGIYMIDTTWVRTYGSKAFYVANNIAATGTITANYSDERLKTKVGNIESALEKVMSLNGFYYVNNELAKSHGYTSDKVQLGLSAQEVELHFPEVVSLAPFDMETEEFSGEIHSKSGENYKTLDYSKLVPVLVEAIKEQQIQINALKSKLGIA